MEYENKEAKKFDSMVSVVQCYNFTFYRNCDHVGGSELQGAGK